MTKPVRDDRSRVRKRISDSRCTLRCCSNQSEADGLRDRLETFLTALVIKAAWEPGHQSGRAFYGRKLQREWVTVAVFLWWKGQFSIPPLSCILSAISQSIRCWQTLFSKCSKWVKVAGILQGRLPDPLSLKRSIQWRAEGREATDLWWMNKLVTWTKSIHQIVFCPNNICSYLSFSSGLL